MARPPVATYSIVACDLEAGQWGVATQSKFLAVGSVVPWAEPHVGAIATQAYANPRYGPDGLALLREGLPAEEVVERLTEADDGREQRQLGVVDGEGGGATFTRRGVQRLGRRPHGSVLRGAGQHPRLGRDRRRARRDVRGDAGRPLAERLLDCLDAAQAAGGDRRGQQSAALLVVERDGGYAGLSDTSSTCASTTTSARSRSCAASTACTRRSSARRRARSGSTSTTSSDRSCASGSAGSATTATSPRRLRAGRATRTWRSASTASTASIPSCSKS